MTDYEKAREIIGQYEKHGWTLRRVLLCGAPEDSCLRDLFGDAPVAASQIDALWFSRGAANGNEAWELRRLSGAPFSLVRVFSPSDDEAARAQSRSKTERAIADK